MTAFTPKEISPFKKTVPPHEDVSNRIWVDQQLLGVQQSFASAHAATEQLQTLVTTAYDWTGAPNFTAGVTGTTAVFSGYVKSLSTVVASLPSAATAGSGARAFVTDATTTTFMSTVAGGGANKVPVVSDGTNWLIG